MKQISLTAYGRPETVCRCETVNDLSDPAPGDVLVEILASAINPADLLIFEGRYPGPESLPAPVGIEGAGRVLAVGEGVDQLAPGDQVMSLGRSNWAERIKAPAGQFVKLPSALDTEQAAMLKANPPSALLMLQNYVDLQPGDWVAQNAANSAVGRHVIRLAKARGLKTINVVRRSALVSELEALGGDLVVVDGEDLGERVRAAVGKEAAVRLGIDAIGGVATQNLADCLSDDGVVVNYGFLSGDACRITPHQTIVHNISLRGFWLYGYMRSAPRADIEALYAELAARFMDGTLDVPVEARYRLEDCAAALAHAGQEARGGKVLFCPRG